MGLDDQEFERIIALKQTPLFRYVPFETIVEVARSVQLRLYLAEEVIADSTGGQDLLILEAGALMLDYPEGAGSSPHQPASAKSPWSESEYPGQG